MPQTCPRPSLTVTLRQPALLVVLIYLVSAAHSHGANDGDSHLVGGSADGQSGGSGDKEASVARIGAQRQPQGLNGLTTKQASLLKQCQSPPVCYRPSLLDTYLSASNISCPVDDQVPVGLADTDSSGNPCTHFDMHHNNIAFAPALHLPTRS